VTPLHVKLIIVFFLENNMWGLGCYTGHASHRRERLRWLEEEGGVPPRRRGARGRCVDVEPDVEHQPEQQEYMDLQQEQPDVELQHMEEQELLAMNEEMEDVEPRRRRKKK